MGTLSIAREGAKSYTDALAALRSHLPVDRLEQVSNALVYTQMIASANMIWQHILTMEFITHFSTEELAEYLLILDHITGAYIEVTASGLSVLETKIPQEILETLEGQGMHVV